jgi:integrase
MARDPAQQAHWAALQMAAHGESRAATRADPGSQSSVGTTRTYEAGLRGLADHLRAERAGDLRSVTADQVRDYLQGRAAQVSQSTLDRDRQAAQAWLSHRDGEAVRLVVVSSQYEGRGLAEQSRTYTPEQVAEVQAHLSERHALAAQVVAETGCRAQEVATLARPGERPATAGRDWREDRHIGREGVTYTVQGKGGLVREVQVSRETAERLEAVRLPEPVQVTDRGAHLTARYEVGHGQALSQAWSSASERALGWSTGIHSVRHSYAQTRLDEIQARGYSYDAAREVVAQEVGHFRSTTTEAYLR